MNYVLRHEELLISYFWPFAVKNLLFFLASISCLYLLAVPVEPVTVKEKKKQFPCYYCDKKFPKIKLLQEHRLNHVVGMGQFPCRLV